MSYTPTEWATGDVVTAEKLNKIEGGIQEAGELPKQSGIVTFEVTTTEFPASGTRYLGYFWYAYLEDDTYKSASMFASPIPIDVVGSATRITYSPFPVPAREDLYLIFVLDSTVQVINVSGGISEEPVAVYGQGLAYIITGDFAIEFGTLLT